MFTIHASTLARVFPIYCAIPEFAPHRPLSYFARRLENAAAPMFWAIERDSANAGFLMAYDRYGDGSYYVWMAGVVPSFRRSGAFELLMAQAAQYAEKQGYLRLVLQTRNRFRHMLAFVVKHGYHFVKVGRKTATSDDYRIHLSKPLSSVAADRAHGAAPSPRRPE